MRRHALSVIVLLLVISSCDNRKDNYTELDTGPVLQVAKLNDTNFSNQISDSVKLGHNYIFKYELQSFDNLSINISKSNTYDVLNINSQASQISVKPFDVEEATYKLGVIDPFDKAA